MSCGCSECNKKYGGIPRPPLSYKAGGKSAKASMSCGQVKRSTRPGKKIMKLYCIDGKKKLVHAGAKGYGHNYSAAARKSFKARHKCSTAKPGTARHLACTELWAGKGGSKKSSPKGRKGKYAVGGPYLNINPYNPLNESDFDLLYKNKGQGEMDLSGRQQRRIARRQTGRNIGAASYGVLEGLVDTLSFGLTDKLTDKGYEALAGLGREQSAARRAQSDRYRVGVGQTIGATAGAILTGGAATGSAIGTTDFGTLANEGPQALQTGLNVAGTVAGVAAGNTSGISGTTGGAFGGTAVGDVSAKLGQTSSFGGTGTGFENLAQTYAPNLKEGIDGFKEFQESNPEGTLGEFLQQNPEILQKALEGLGMGSGAQVNKYGGPISFRAGGRRYPHGGPHSPTDPPKTGKKVVSFPLTYTPYTAEASSTNVVMPGVDAQIQQLDRDAAFAESQGLTLQEVGQQRVAAQEAEAKRKQEEEFRQYVSDYIKIYRPDMSDKDLDAEIQEVRRTGRLPQYSVNEQDYKSSIFDGSSLGKYKAYSTDKVRLATDPDMRDRQMDFMRKYGTEPASVNAFSGLLSPFSTAYAMQPGVSEAEYQERAANTPALLQAADLVVPGGAAVKGAKYVPSMMRAGFRGLTNTGNIARRYLNAPLTIGSRTIPYVTAGDAIGAGFATRGAYNLGTHLDSGFRDFNVEEGLITGLDLLGTPGMGSAFRSVPKAFTTAGNYLTTQTPLRNTYRINPFRFRANPEAFYHRSPDLYNIIDETGGVLQGYGLSQAGKQAEQASQVSSGINLSKDPNTRLYFSKGVPLDWGRYNIKRRQDFKYELPRFSLDPLRQRYTNRQGYAGPFMVEVQGVPMGRSIKGRAPGKPPTAREAYATPYEPIPLDQAKFYKEDWLRGYKEIPRPKGEVKPFQSEINWAAWNPNTPKYPELINEYNAIEAATKRAGTWMKNPDGTPFQGPPELFIQTQSRYFKNAFPEGYNTVYRGTRGRNTLPTTTSFDRETGKSTSALFSADEALARTYSTSTKPEEMPFITPFMAYRNLEGQGFSPGVFKLAVPKVGNKNLSFAANRDGWTNVNLLGKDRATLEAALAQQKSIYNRMLKKPESAKDYSFRNVLAQKEKQIAELEAVLNDPRGTVSNVAEFQKMREALGNVVTTDRIAQYLETTNLPSIQLRNVNDGGLGDVTIINRRPGMYPKSLIGNVGFFDMTNPDVFKAAIPVVGGAAGYGLLQNSEFKRGGYQGGLRRWFKEKWVDVKTGKACGRSGKEKSTRAYPYCRPSRKVSSKTPATSKHPKAKSRAKQKTGPSRVKPISQRKRK